MICHFYDSVSLQCKFDWHGVDKLPELVRFDCDEVYSLEFHVVEELKSYNKRSVTRYSKRCKSLGEFWHFVSAVALHVE